MGMWTPWHGGDKTLAMRQTENDWTDSEDKWDDGVSESGSGARAHLI